MLAPVSVALLATAACLRRVWATDFWWQFATGRFVAEHGWPRADVFSYTAPGAEWIEMRWLYCLAQYEVMEHLGPPALIALKWLVVSLAFGLVALPFARRTSAVAASAVLAPAILASTQRLLLRPELVTWLFFGAFVVVLDVHRRRGGRWIYLLPLLQILWVNTHPTFVLGPLLIGLSLVVVGGKAIVAGGESPLRLLRPLGVVLALSIAACLVNPYGLQGALVPLDQFAQIRESVFKEVISEYRTPFSFGLAHTAVIYYEILLALCVVSAAANLRRLDPFWLILCASQLYLSTIAIRNLPLFSLAAVPFVLSNLERSAWLRRIPPGVMRSGRRLVAVLVVAGCAWYVHQLATDRFSVRQNDSKQAGVGISEYRYPTEAVDFLDGAGLDGRVYATLLESSYLVARGREVFADPRGDFYGDAHFRRYMTIQKDPVAWREAVDQYDIRIALASNGSRFVDLLQRDDDWKLVFFDTVAAVYLRTDSLADIRPIDTEEDFERALSAVRERLPPATAYSDAAAFERVTSPKPYLSLADLAIGARRIDVALELLDEAETASPFMRGIVHRRTALAQARRDYPLLLKLATAAVEETPDDAQVLLALGEAQFHLDHREESARWLERSVEIRPEGHRAWSLLGQIAMLDQDYPAAAELLRRAVEFSPQNVTYRHNLSRALAVSGLRAEAISQLDRVLEIEPDNVTALRDLAILHLDGGDLAHAREYLDRALARAPDDPVLARLGETLDATRGSGP